MQVTIDQVIGGARGIKSMIWETSNLDADEVSEPMAARAFSGCPRSTFSGCGVSALHTNKHNTGSSTLMETQRRSRSSSTDGSDYGPDGGRFASVYPCVPLDTKSYTNL